MLLVVIVVVMLCLGVVFFFKQKTAYEMRISDWSSDVCSSDLVAADLWGEFKFKDGDELLFAAHAQTTDKLLIAASDGRFFTVGADKLPEIGRASCRERVCQYV